MRIIRIQQVRVQCRMIGSGRDKYTVRSFVFTQNEQLFRVSGQSGSLTDGPVVEAFMRADHLTRVDVHKQARFVADVLLNEFAEIAFAHETNAGALAFLHDPTEPSFVGDSLYLVFAKMPERKHRVSKCLLRHLRQKERLVFKVVDGAK